MKQAVGLGLRHPFHGYVLENKPAVPFFEVITENYLFLDGAPRSFLRRVRDNYPLVFHGVSLSIGSLEPVRIDYLVQLKKMIAEYEPLWISDHLSWSYNGAENSHDLLPITYTKESLNRIVRKAQQVQEFLGQKIYFENPSAYVSFQSNEYAEEEFISELCKKSGCGLLLDLNNLVVNQHNLGYNPCRYLETVSQCDVKQIHLSGHTIKEQVRIDTHDTNISQEVLDLLPLARKYWPQANPMIEWDDKIPPVEYLLEVRNEIEANWKNAVTADFPEVPNSFSSAAVTAAPDLDAHQEFWKVLKTEDYVSASIVENAGIIDLKMPTPAHVGMNVYSSGYYNRQLDVLKNIFPCLKSVLDELFDDVALEYLKHYPSTHDSIDFIGNNLATFIEAYEFPFSLGVSKFIVADIARFEILKNSSLTAFLEPNPSLVAKSFTEEDWVTRELKVKSEVKLARFNSEIHHAIESIQIAEIPEIPNEEKAYYLFFRDPDRFNFRAISEEEFNFFNHFADFRIFSDCSQDQLQTFAKLLMENQKLFCVQSANKR